MPIIALSVLGMPEAIEVQLATFEQTKKRRGVRYHASVETLAEAVSMQGTSSCVVVIPFKLAATDYDYRYLIEHIRTARQTAIQIIPIIVHTGSAREYPQAMAGPGQLGWDGYRAISVVPTGADGALPSVWPLPVDAKALTAYQQEIGLKPRFGGGAHDQANAWGAYALLRALSHIRGQGVADLPMLEERLLEETFYKKRIQSLSTGSADANLVERVRETRSRYIGLARGMSPYRVLAVEDQWNERWGPAYTAVLNDEGVIVHFHHVTTYEEARRAIGPNWSLVMLDVRLGAADAPAHEKLNLAHFSSLAGMRLAEEIREQAPTVPVIAATASNKVWALEALLEQGVSGYWVKASPDTTKCLDDALSNLQDLYVELIRVLEWSRRTRRWVDDVYGIARQARKKNPEVSEGLTRKAKSLHALLHRGFGPFANDLDKGLQFNLAFLIVFSMQNDLISLACTSEAKRGIAEICVMADSKRHRVATCNLGQRSYELSDEVVKAIGAAGGKSVDFPDTNIIKFLLYCAGEEKRINCFDSLVRLRNAMPQVHGATDPLEDGQKKARSAKEEDISHLVDMYAAIAALATR